MKRSLKNIIGYSINPVGDGPKGKVKDFLFDEEKWVIRYMEADFGSFFESKRVLIPRLFIGTPDWDKEEISINLSEKDIDSCPAPEKKLPISRAYEMELNKYYDIDHYWMYDFGAVENPMLYPPRPVGIPAKLVDEKDLDTSLRSYDEVTGYHINALDGKLGHIDDIIVDDEDWQIVYLIADTSNWLPWSKKVILPIDFLNDISYVNQEVSIHLEKDSIKNAPEFDRSRPLEPAEEKSVYDFLSSIMVDK
ncbi:MAG: PRC-barrel domain-containing protein [Bacteroidota bacterium]